MSSLFVYHVSNPGQPLKVLNHLQDIASTLAGQGIVFERRPVPVAIAPGASQAQVLAGCQASLDALRHERGVEVVQVISLDHGWPTPATASDPRLAEHCHDVDETCWFVAGRGQLSLHLGEHVYVLWCEKDDLLALPAGTAQWFDAGEHPRLVVIRMFNGAAVSPRPVDDGIASRFPRLED